MLSLLICLSLPIRSSEIIISSACLLAHKSYGDCKRKRAEKPIALLTGNIKFTRNASAIFSESRERMPLPEPLCNHCAHGENSIVTSYPEIKWRQLMGSREICEEHV